MLIPFRSIVRARARMCVCVIYILFVRNEIQVRLTSFRAILCRIALCVNTRSTRSGIVAYVPVRIDHSSEFSSAHFIPFVSYELISKF